MQTTQFATLVTGGPPLPPTLDATDPLAIEKYCTELLIHAAKVETFLNQGKTKDLKTNTYTWGIGEDGSFKGSVAVKVNLGAIQLVS